MRTMILFSAHCSGTCKVSPRDFDTKRTCFLLIGSARSSRHSSASRFANSNFETFGALKNARMKPAIEAET